MVRHRTSAPYVATLTIDGAKRVVDIAGDWVSVLFFDEQDRNFLRYDFKRVEPERLFLSLAVHLAYTDEEHRPGTSLTFAFKPDGAIVIERRNMASGEVEEKDSQGDLRSNWEAYPAFGQYSSVCRVNRE